MAFVPVVPTDVNVRSGRQQGFVMTPSGPQFGVQLESGEFRPAGSALSPEQRRAITAQFQSGTFQTPTPSLESGGSRHTGGSTLAPSKVGSQEGLLADLFSSVLKGTPTTPIAKTIFDLIQGGASPFVRSLSEGQIPPELRAAFEDNLKRQLAGITESFGSIGARFGTDLASTLGQASGEAERGFAADVINRAIAAEQLRRQTQLNSLTQLLGLGGTTAGFEFGRSENALNRALEEFLARQQSDPLTLLLQSMIGGGA